jgi:eukaryotic-like serine/threonine-protein kinase
MEPITTPRVLANRYELTHLIARGGMAQVFRARDRLLDRPVAVKVLFPELSVDQAFVERFRREAQAAANLSHPNIVPVFDWGEDGGTYFIVMEFVDGQPLSAVLRATGPMPPAKVADIGINVAAALAFAHRHGVIHRDVKPGNVLITDDGQVKVTDFGIARAVNTEESLTQTGAVMGTATYFSPEQAEGIGVDSRSDLYSLGVVLYEMVAGRPPFLGDTPVAVASKHVRDAPPELRDLAPAVPPALEAVIMKAMAKAADDRYAGADDLRADLVRFTEGLPVSAAAATSTQIDQVAADATGATAAVAGTRAVPLADELFYTDEQFQEDERRHRRNLILLIAALIAVLAAAAILILHALGILGGNTFAMPDVVGQPTAAASSTLDAKGLDIVATHGKISSQSIGTVLATTPKAGASVKSGDAVTLTVSTGIPAAQVLVPKVTGQSLTAAEEILHNEKLASTVKYVTSNAPQNTVLAQTPAAGRTVAAHSTVILSVPKTTTTITVPTVAGQTAVKAASAIGAKGLQAGATTMQCSNSFGKGLVISTNPAAGTQAPKNSTVTLVVSSGPCSGAVANVVGKTRTTAGKTLTNQGFTNVAYKTTANCTQATKGKVLKQTPTAGSQSTTSKTVTLTVCAPGPVTPPALTVTSPTGTATTARAPSFAFVVNPQITSGQATHAPTLVLQLPAGSKLTFNGTPSSPNWTCSLTSPTTITCVATNKTPITKGQLSPVTAAVSVPTTTGTATLSATLSDTADTSHPAKLTLKVTLN